MSDIAIKIENLKKQYRLGAIGGATLTAELQSWWAKKRGREDPNLKLGQDASAFGKRFLALDGINLEIRKGEALGIIGSNGAGKSTLLKILSRVTAPTEGDIWIDGRISSMLEVGTGFHGELTGRENIYMNGAILGMTKKEVDEKIDSIIEFSECGQFIDTPVKRYSSGMYVKLAFAVASHLNAEIMIMDEVLAVGDMKYQKKCLGKMSEEAEGGKTILYVSHNMATIRNLCTRCIVLQKGHLIFDGDPKEAIEIYSGNSEHSQCKTKYIFDRLARRTFLLGKSEYIHSAEFLKKSQTLFFDDETMKLCVMWSNKTPSDELHFRLVFQKLDSTIIGMAESDVIKEAGQPGEHRSVIAVKMNHFAPGHYQLIISLNNIHFGGQYDMRDEAPAAVNFTVEENASIQKLNSMWVHSTWGNVRFDNLEVTTDE